MKLRKSRNLTWGLDNNTIFNRAKVPAVGDFMDHLLSFCILQVVHFTHRSSHCMVIGYKVDSFVPPIQFLEVK